MTERETNAIREIAGDVRELGQKFDDLRLEVRNSFERDKMVMRDVAAVHSEVFGIEGDPQRPGLKGQLRDVHATLDGHADRLKAIQTRESWGISLMQSALLLVLGALFTAIFRHWLP